MARIPETAFKTETLMGPHLRSALADPAANGEKPFWFDTDKCFIDGRWVAAQSGRTLPIEDPSRGIEIGEIARGRPPTSTRRSRRPSARFAGAWGV